MNTFNPPNNMTIADFPFPIHTGAIKPKWAEEAQKKGYNILARIVDRMHLALQCKLCGGISKVRHYTLTSANPLCSHCIEQVWQVDAVAAGLEFIKRDPARRNYAFYRMPCGHEISRQFELIKRVAAGETGLRCETCRAAMEVSEAAALGWDLIGPDSEGDPNYRIFQHAECGHTQRIARANIQTQRFSCGGCGIDWPAAPSFIYLMRFISATGRELIKAGFSRNPTSRMHHQLVVGQEMPCEILRTVAVPTGRQALCIEKGLHKMLQLNHPECIVDPASYRGQIRVASEIYDASLTPTILGHLDDIEAELGTNVECRAA
ncbi:GIY-YIG nuclease family protein [uncultured Sulfitobacter sp.]|uniref:GIY-YIG nuclease family protein n=1 Tax=uncultured Sulfitobacter sp. TaxID=191468 RepID=UPI00262843DF|nr:GIY-YIG nuclease family protein [uncultured Sulfitobacter sp.]